MTAALRVIAAALALTPLPARGLALETKGGVELQTLSGRPITTLAQLDLAPDQAVAHKLVLRGPRGRLFVVDRRGLRATTARRGCRATDARLVVCARTIRSGARIVAHAPRGIGHWVWAERSPSGDAILAQWSAECEVPVAYRIRNGMLTAYGSPESVALGWLPSGDALIHYPNGPCAGDSQRGRGIYAVARTGKPRLVLRTPRFAQYLMWGG
jgi:hypothetical protein